MYEDEGARPNDESAEYCVWEEGAGITRRTLLKGLATAAAGTAAVGFLGLSTGCSSTASGSTQAPEFNPKPGTYPGEAEGKHGPVVLEVTFGSKKIDAVKVVSHTETPDLSDVALSVVPAAIVAAQSLGVDTVSGATLTSMAVIKAVADAAKKAGADPVALYDAPATISVTQKMTPGTYKGEAYGKWKKGTIEGERFGCPAIIKPTTVEVKVDQTKILSVNVLSCSDTPGFNEPAVQRTPTDIVEQQSLYADTVVGATLTAAAITSATAKALKEAGADLVGFAKATAPKPSADVTHNVDLCIVGAGTAGTSACLKALEEGLSVVVIEKTARISGMGACATGPLVVASNEEKAAGNKTTVDEVFTDMMNYYYWKTNAALTYDIISNSGPMADWLQGMWKQAGQKGFTRIPVAPGYIQSQDFGKGTAKFQALYDKFVTPNSKAKVLLNTSAHELIKDKDTIKGVKATMQNGTKVTVNAKATLITTGGFGGNKAMQRELLGSDFFYLNGVAANVGDGINMCRKAGAVLSEEVCPHIAEFCSNDVLDFYAGYMKFINQVGYLMLDPAGNRYFNEGYCATNALQRSAGAMRRVGYSYIFFTQGQLDSMIKDGIWKIVPESLIKEVRYRDRIIVKSYYTLGDEMKEALEKGQAWKADTLEALGKAIGFDPTTYGKTIADYLKVVAAKKDPLYGKRPEFIQPLDKGPFYAVKVISPIDGTFNGIKINTEFRPLDENQKPSLKGLYIAGQDSGGYYSYPYTEYVGATCGYALTSGMLAAKAIAKQLKA